MVTIFGKQCFFGIPNYYQPDWIIEWIISRFWKKEVPRILPKNKTSKERIHVKILKLILFQVIVTTKSIVNFNSNVLYLEKDDITDLDIAYSIIFDEMKKEYMRERERGRDKRDGDRAAIPQRIFQSFLVSIENDVNEYVSVLNCDVILVQ